MAVPQCTTELGFGRHFLSERGGISYSYLAPCVPGNPCIQVFAVLDSRDECWIIQGPRCRCEQQEQVRLAKGYGFVIYRQYTNLPQSIEFCRRVPTAGYPSWMLNSDATTVTKDSEDLSGSSAIARSFACTAQKYHNESIIYVFGAKSQSNNLIRGVGDESSAHRDANKMKHRRTSTCLERNNVHPCDERLTLSQNTRKLRRARHDLRFEYVRFAVVLKTKLPRRVPPHRVFLVRGTYVRRFRSLFLNTVDLRRVQLWETHVAIKSSVAVDTDGIEQGTSALIIDMEAEKFFRSVNERRVVSSHQHVQGLPGFISISYCRCWPQ